MNKTIMKKFFVFIILTFVFLSCAQSAVDEKSILIDVRTEQEFKQGHLKNAINIPHTEIRGKIKDYVKDKEEKIIVYCRTGRRSGIAKKILEDMGYKNVINAGAYEKLKEQRKYRQ